MAYDMWVDVQNVKTMRCYWDHHQAVERWLQAGCVAPLADYMSGSEVYAYYWQDADDDVAQLSRWYKTSAPDEVLVAMDQQLADHAM